MDDPGDVGRGERTGDLLRDVERRPQFDRPRLDYFA
jgi:hypothetical protein